MVHAMRGACRHCGEVVVVPLAGVLISYHRSNTARDVFRFRHGECPFTFRALTEAIAEAFEDAIAEHLVQVDFIDPEFDDGVHNLGPMSEWEQARFLRSLASLSRPAGSGQDRKA